MLEACQMLCDIVNYQEIDHQLNEDEQRELALHIINCSGCGNIFSQFMSRSSKSAKDQREVVKSGRQLLGRVLVFFKDFVLFLEKSEDPEVLNKMEAEMVVSNFLKRFPVPALPRFGLSEDISNLFLFEMHHALMHLAERTAVGQLDADLKTVQILPNGGVLVNGQFTMNADILANALAKIFTSIESQDSPVAFGMCRQYAREWVKWLAQVQEIHPRLFTPLDKLLSPPDAWRVPKAESLAVA